MTISSATGLCPRCRQANRYTKFTCDFCGDRLPWSDSFAATTGEPCPNCAQFNPYLNAQCSACEQRLPWADAAAPQRHAKVQSPQEQKSIVVTVMLCGLVFFLVLALLMMSTPAHIIK